MKARSLLLEAASTLLGVLTWLLGWPVLRQLNQALNIFLAIVVCGAVIFGAVLAYLIIRSQLEPPYGS
jgi:hypothetical protein